MKREKLKMPESAAELGGASFEELFAKYARNKEFVRLYEEEVARIRLATQIRKLRSQKHLTQKAVAHKVGTTQSVIARIESGGSGLSLDTLTRVASVFGKKVALV